MKVRTLFYTLAILTTGLVYSGFPDQEQPSVSLSDLNKKPACDLLTAEEIQGVLGQSVTKGTQRSDLICEYRRTTAPMGAPSLMVRLDYADKAPQEALETYHMVMKIGLGDDYKPLSVSGIGDLAIWDTHNGSLVTFKGLGESRSAMITIKPEDKDTQKAQAAAKALARVALGKL